MLSEASKFEMSTAAARDRGGIRLKNVVLAMKIIRGNVQNLIYITWRRAVSVPKQFEVQTESCKEPQLR